MLLKLSETPTPHNGVCRWGIYKRGGYGIGYGRIKPGHEYAVDRFGRVGARDAQHTNAPAGSGKNVPQGGRLAVGTVQKPQPVTARDHLRKIHNAVTTRIDTGHARGPRRKCHWRQNALQRPEASCRFQCAKPRQPSLFNPFAGKVRRKTIKAYEQYPFHETYCTKAGTYSGRLEAAGYGYDASKICVDSWLVPAFLFRDRDDRRPPNFTDKSDYRRHPGRSGLAPLSEPCRQLYQLSTETRQEPNFSIGE